MYLVKLTNDQMGEWKKVKKEDVVSSVYMENLKIISAEKAKERGIIVGAKKMIEDEEFLRDCDYAPCYLGNYINIDDIDGNDILFDSFSDKFFYIGDIETDKYYLYYDGSNFKMVEILEKKELEAVLIDTESYDTGIIETYKAKNEEFKVDNSFYQGSINNVLKEYTDVIDNIII